MGVIVFSVETRKELMITAEVRQTDVKVFEVFIGSQIIGTAKSDCDARFTAHFLNKLFEQEYDRGYADGDENGYRMGAEDNQ